MDVAGGKGHNASGISVFSQPPVSGLAPSSISSEEVALLMNIVPLAIVCW